MSKKLNKVKWESVAVEGFPVAMTDKFQGFVGLEECTDYSFDKENKRSKKKKENKRKLDQDTEKQEVPIKKVKLSNGFVVESCSAVKPTATTEKKSKNKRKNKKKKKDQKSVDITNNDSIEENTTTNIVAPSNDKKPKDKRKKPKNKKTPIENAPTTEEVPSKKGKPKLGVLPQTNNELTAEDMLTWAEFKLPETILKALTELGYKQPTKIQQLTLPAAIHGRRDILGAAETGSGKTLAFGLPILSGILKLKEKAEAKGLDVYDIPYKKNSAKKQVENKPDLKTQKKKKKEHIKKNKKVIERKAKESSEDGYSSGEGDDDDGNNENDNSNNTQMPDKEPSADEGNDSDSEAESDTKSDDYIEEIDVPLRKRETAEEENGSDEDNYIHLSDMLDSDDLADSGDDDDHQNNETVDDSEETETGDEIDRNDQEGNETDSNEEVGDESGVENEDDESNEVNENEQGIGCVKVVDNIEMPGHVVIRTGKPLYALIMTPTRELAIQISRHLTAAAKFTGIRVATIVGGMAAVKQERVLRAGPEVVVATPGRLWELIGQGQPHLQQLDTVKFLAIDETDRMIERGHFEELYPLLERLNVDECSRAARQNFVFSATLTMVHDLPTHMKGKKVTKRGKIINRKIQKMTPQQKIGKLVKMIGMTDPKVVDITTENLGTADSLTESRIACALEHKDAYLFYLVKRHPGRSIVFCNSIGSVKRLAQLFTILQCRPLPLHAGMPQRQRLKNLERFQADPHGVLIATDVAARGLDIPKVDHVIHYQVPRTAESYVHRSGRTARAHREGLAVLIMDPSEAYLYAKLCRTLNKTSELPTFPVEPQILSTLKEVVILARELDTLELKKRRTAQAMGWREKAAKEMDIVIDEDDIPTKTMDPTIDKALQAKRRQLSSLLSRPIYPRGFSFKYPTLNDQTALKVSEENALQVMKNAIQSGQIKKEKRKSKNAPLLQLQKALKNKKELK